MSEVGVRGYLSKLDLYGIIIYVIPHIVEGHTCNPLDLGCSRKIRTPKFIGFTRIFVILEFP